MANRSFLIAMPIFFLPEEPVFPNPELAHSSGMLAIGGDLSIERLLAAYNAGIFPWFEDDSELQWFSPPERCVLFLDELKISKSMHQVLKKKTFELKIDTNFDEVIRNCSTIDRPDQDGTWITDGIIAAYTKLHQLGHAHSFETYQGGMLVGGLYGVSIGKAFMGESMFSKTSNASKFAFIKLAEFLKLNGFEFIDCQVYNPHLESLGACVIPRKTFLKKLKLALAQEFDAGNWGRLSNRAE